MKLRGSTIRVSVVKLGCAKNSVDSEIMESLLEEEGFCLTDEGELDAVIINTCGFIREAKEESLDEIFRFLEMKKEGRVKKVLVGGCLSQRYFTDLEREIPEVDRFFPISSLGDICAMVKDEVSGKTEALNVTKPADLEEIYRKRARLARGNWAFLKITEGCSNFCSYCAIPSIRGPMVSRTPDSVMDEIRLLAGRGVKEINLVGQDISSFGRDYGSEDGLAELIEMFEGEKLDDLWIRLLYLHPGNITTRLIRAMRDNPLIVKYADIPIQHGSSRLLKKMNRNYSREYLEEIFTMIREEIGNIVLRTTVLVGFPGETEEDFYDLIDLISKVRFDRLGGFAYSDEEGTAAYSWNNKVSVDKAQARLEELLNLQADISLEKNSSLVGKDMDILVEENSGEGKIRGRYYGQAPEVDGFVEVTCSYRAPEEGFIKARITSCDHYDLFGRSLR